MATLSAVFPAKCRGRVERVAVTEPATLHIDRYTVAGGGGQRLRTKVDKTGTR